MEQLGPSKPRYRKRDRLNQQALSLYLSPAVKDRALLPGGHRLPTIELVFRRQKSYSDAAPVREEKDILHARLGVALACD